MILICDSGSTKADWALLDGINFSEFQTDGLNPIHLSEATILEKLSAEKSIISNASAITEVNFFGAGCGSSEGKERMAGVLRIVFPIQKLRLTMTCLLQLWQLQEMRKELLPLSEQAATAAIMMALQSI